VTSLKGDQNYLIGVRLELAQLDALFQFDSSDLAQIFQVHFTFLKILQQNLDSRLTIVLTVGHQVDSGTFKMLQKNSRKIVT
jgi:hypothetical protein